MSGGQHKDRCVDLFRKPGEKGHVGKSLRKISSGILQKFPNLSPTSLICATCYKKFLSELKEDDQHIYESYNSTSSLVFGDSSMEMDANISHTSHDDENSLTSKREQELEEMLNGLKDKFNSLDWNDPLRLRILTIAPSSWSIRKIATEFNTTKHFAAKAKQLKSIRGVLGETTKKCGKSLPQTTVDKVIEFYTSDLNSRLMPGMKDVVSVKKDEKRTLVQKRLLLLGLNELYAVFMDSNADYEISFSAFAKLRPKNCILAGAAGTHSVCVCIIHQNVKLMLDAINVEVLTKDTEMPVKNYKDCLSKIICQQPSPDCWLDNCTKCPGTYEFFQQLSSILQGSQFLQVQCSVWAGTDRSTLLTQTLNTEDFMDMLCTKLQILKSHSFIAKEQSNFIAEKKLNLCKDEVIVMFDFSENYSYVCQDVSQAFHFNNNQCTVFNVIYYWKENDRLMHKSNVFLSPSLKHDTAAVYTVQGLLIPEIKKTVENVNKIIYITDGAKQHFKNRYQVTNLIHHKEDFGIEAEWHYSATAHGKSAYDGIGATFKRESYRASLLAKPGSEMLTAESLFAWAKDHFQTINIFYFSKNDHEKIRRKLNKRFENAPAVPEINKNHGIIVLSDKPNK